MATQNIETQIAHRIISKALKAGYTVSVNDGEEWALKRSSDRSAICAAIQSTDHDYLRFRNAAGENLGWVMLVWGNGDCVVSDHIDNDAMRALVGDEFDGK